MIQIKSLSKSYDKPVLDNVYLDIPDGTVFGLVGINGAGKSTLLKIMAGVMKPDLGGVYYDSKLVFENVDVKKDIFFLPDDPFYGRNTTPRKIVNLYEVFYDLDSHLYFDLLTKFQIPLDKSMYNFSKGMKRQVFVALALAIKPKYLFLDEAFDGLDPLARLTLKKELLKTQNENNMTVVISSHSLRELEDICDSYALLDNRQISSSGSISDNLSKYHKYMLAFSEGVSKDSFKDIELISYKQEKRIVTIVTSIDYEAFKLKVTDLKPLVVDEVSIDFEELFILEVEARGYMK